MKSLIEAYQTLFPFRGATQTISSLNDLKSIIKTELLDELTHPRVRKNSSEKLQLAFLRIDESSLAEQEKTSLKAFYEEVFNSVNTF
jgi:hypothetical protein